MDHCKSPFDRQVFGNSCEAIFLGDLMVSSFPGWNFDANYSEEAENGRIVVILNPILSVVTYLKTPQLVLCGFFNPVTNQAFSVPSFMQGIEGWKGCLSGPC